MSQGAVLLSERSLANAREAHQEMAARVAVETSEWGQDYDEETESGLVYDLVSTTVSSETIPDTVKTLGKTE